MSLVLVLSGTMLSGAMVYRKKNKLYSYSLVIFYLILMSGLVDCGGQLFAEPPVTESGQEQVKELLETLKGNADGETGLAGLAKKLGKLKDTLSELLGRITGAPAATQDQTGSSITSEQSGSDSDTGVAGKGSETSGDQSISPNASKSTATSDSVIPESKPAAIIPILSPSLAFNQKDLKKLEAVVNFFVTQAQTIKEGTLLNFTDANLENYKELQRYRYDAFSSMVQLAFLSLCFYRLYAGTITVEKFDKLDNFASQLTVLFQNDWDKLPIKGIVAFVPLLTEAGNLSTEPNQEESKRIITIIRDELGKQLSDQNYLTTINAFALTLGFLYEKNSQSTNKITQEDAKAALYQAISLAVREFQIAQMTIAFIEKIKDHGEVSKQAPQKNPGAETSGGWFAPVTSALSLASWGWSGSEESSASNDKTPLHEYAEDINSRLRAYFDKAAAVINVYDALVPDDKNSRKMAMGTLDLADFICGAFLLPHKQMSLRDIDKKKNNELRNFETHCRSWFALVDKLIEDLETFEFQDIKDVFKVDRIKVNEISGDTENYTVAFDDQNKIDLLEIKGGEKAIVELREEVNTYAQGVIDRFFMTTDELALDMIKDAAQNKEKDLLYSARDNRTGGNILHMIVSRAMISGPHFLNKKTLAPILQTLMKDDTLLKAKNNLGQTPVFLAFKNGLSWLFLQNNQVDILNHKNNQGQNIFHYVVQEQLLTSAICNFDDTDISGPGSTGSTGEIKLGKTSVQRKKSFKQGLLYEELNKLFTDKNNRLTIKGLLLEKDNSGKTPFHYALSQKQYYVYNLLLNWYKQVGGEQKELQKLNLPSYYQNATEDSAKIDAAVLKMGEVESTFDELRTNPAQAGG